MFINFRDHKGKLDQAISKMLGDLKKFGLPNIKNFKVSDLLKGHGEQVCQLVDELVNLELYRRDFEFIAPVIPPDDEDDMIEEQSFNQDEDLQGKSELINGIEINHHDLMSPSGLAGK